MSVERYVSAIRRLERGLKKKKGVRTILFLDLRLYVEVDTSNYGIGEDVQRAHAVEDIWVIERNLLRDLHKRQDDEKVGTARDR